MKTQTFTTIPENITKMGELVVLSRKEFEKILEAKLEEQKLLHLSREAKILKKEGRLPVLRSLRDLR